MKKALLILVALLTFTAPTFATTFNNEKAAAYAQVYDDLHLESLGLRKEVFDYALRGFIKKGFNKSVLTIADLSQPSSKKRMYVIDLDNRKLLFHTYVSHGRGSGELVANDFSNTHSSYKSSLGFYQTLNTYQGKHGLSLKLKGLEKGINDNAYSRAIVLHGADYCSEDVVRRTGRLGRSQGCPAVPNALSKGIIRAIQGGSCLFIYAFQPQYLQQSSYLLPAA